MEWDLSKFPHDTRGGVVVGAVVFCLVVATVAVALRLYTRRFMINSVGHDDWVATISLLLAYATGIGQCVNTTNGLGKHGWDIPWPEGFSLFLRNFWFTLVFYNACLLFVKLTFLLQYYRIIKPVFRIRVLYIITMIIVSVWSLANVFLIIFSCIPVEGFWNGGIGAKCVSNVSGQYINAAGNIATDFVILILPLPMLFKLKLPKPQKLGLVVVFSVGFVTIAISIVRLTFLHAIVDMPYESVTIACWSIGELCSGITCAALPTLRPLVAHYLPYFSTKSARPTGTYGPYSDFSSPAARKSMRSPELHEGEARRARHFSKESETELVYDTNTPEEVDLELQYPRRSHMRRIDPNDVEESSGGEGTMWAPIRYFPGSENRNLNMHRLSSNNCRGRNDEAGLDFSSIGLVPSVSTNITAGGRGSPGMSSLSVRGLRGIRVKRDFVVHKTDITKAEGGH